MTSFIGQYYLDDLDLCDEIINFFDSSNDLVYKGTVGYNEVNTDHKDCDQCNLNENNLLFQKYVNSLIVASNKYIEEYKFVNHYAPWGIIEPINVKRYTPPSQAFHGWHTERADSSMPVCLRTLVFMTYLNDISDGGETEYYYQKLKIKPKKGLTVFWPADWTHTHRGLISQTETKYIVTGWMSYLPKSN